MVDRCKFFSLSTYHITVSGIQGAVDLAVGFSIDRFDEAKGFTGEKIDEVKSCDTFKQVTDFIVPIFEDIKLKIIALMVNMPLIGNEIVVDKSKDDAATASTASLQTLDTTATKKKTKKEDYNEFLKMMEK